MVSICIAANLSANIQFLGCVITVYCLSGICVIGFFLNLVSIIIFFMAVFKGQRTSMIVYLIALSFFDSLQLLLSFFLIALQGSKDYLMQGGSYEIAQRLDPIIIYSLRLFYPFLMAANYGSIWTVTLICVQRYFAICYPLSSLRTVDMSRSICQVLVVTLVAFVLNVSRFWEFELEYLKSGENSTELMLAAGPLHQSRNDIYFLIMGGVVYSILLYVVPFTFVSILNVKILMAIYASRKIQAQISQKRRKEHRSAFMVLTIILLFFICYTLAVAERVWAIADKELYTGPTGVFLNELNNFLVNLNSCLDPMIYFLFSRGFRDIFTRFRSGPRKCHEEASGLNNGKVDADHVPLVKRPFDQYRSFRYQQQHRREVEIAMRPSTSHLSVVSQQDGNGATCSRVLRSTSEICTTTLPVIEFQ